jgi:Protein phosphatase 2C
MAPRSWRIAAASAIGTSHVATGLPCQDFAHCSVIDTRGGPTLVSVVCDGAGSAAHSDIGAWLAASTFAELVELHFEEGGGIADLSKDKAREWIRAVGDALESRAKEAGHSLRDYACTLLAAIIGSREAAFLQVGDGAIVVSHGEEDGWSYVFWPQHGEYANTTNFVVSANARDVMEFEVAPRRIDELAMFSDGIENLVLHQNSRTVHGRFFDQMMPPVRKAAAPGLDTKLSDGLRSYLSSSTICERTDDDKSLILASRRPPIAKSVDP